MKLLIVLIFYFYVANVQCSVSPDIILAIINEAKQVSAPFRDEGLSRLKGEIFGSGRAARSSDIILNNKSDKNFKMRNNSCKWGGWSSNMFPEHDLPKHTSSVFGIESNGFMSGVECAVQYVAPGEIYFEVVIDNPYYGHNQIHQYNSDSLVLLSTLGQGNNNQVRWVIDNK